jgi:class 3 adenylate cyclase
VIRGQPETRYATVGDADVAFQVVGDGPIDLLFCYGFGSHLELMWEIPAAAEVLNGFASFSRLIFFDRRGTGASDGVAISALPTWERWAEDIRAVLDAAGSKRAAVLASLDAGPIAILFAAMHPERVSALILLNTTARYLAADDYPFGFSSSDVDEIVNLFATGENGTEDLQRLFNPGRANDPEFIRLAAKMVRSSATPRSAGAQLDYMLRSMDVRQALPLIQAPTLVLQVSGFPLLNVAHGHYLAEHIDGAQLRILPGADIGPSPADYSLVDEVAEFLTGERPVIEIDRVLTTVLFTDIVRSTERLVAVGDRRWRELLDAHDRTVREQLRRYRGREINTTGDGFFASFDGPARAIQCAQTIIDLSARSGVDIRAGLHTGECEVRGDDLAGLAVHVAARVGALAESRELLVTSTVRDLVAGSGITFAERGLHALKGVPDEWHLFAVPSA